MSLYPEAYAAIILTISFPSGYRSFSTTASPLRPDYLGQIPWLSMHLPKSRVKGAVEIFQEYATQIVSPTIAQWEKTIIAMRKIQVQGQVVDRDWDGQGRT